MSLTMIGGRATARLRLDFASQYPSIFPYKPVNVRPPAQGEPAQKKQRRR